MTFWQHVVKFFDHYPPRWWCPIVNIYGSTREGRAVYMTRAHLTPKTRWGQGYLHIFHRPDMDRDPHDHPFPFTTLPLNAGYFEEVYNTRRHCWTTLHVPQWKRSHRAAAHCHRVVATDKGTWPLVTLVWRYSTTRKWGFWCHEKGFITVDRARMRHFVPMLDYLNNGTDANTVGIDVPCPGRQ